MTANRTYTEVYRKKNTSPNHLNVGNLRAPKQGRRGKLSWSFDTANYR